MSPLENLQRQACTNALWIVVVGFILDFVPRWFFQGQFQDAAVSVMSGQSAFMQDTYIKLENAYPGHANKFILSQAAIALFSVIVTIVVIIKVASSDKMQAMEPIETLNRLLMFMFLISAIVVAQVFLFYHPPLRSGAKYTLLPVFG